MIIPKVYNGRNKTFVYGTFEKYTQSDYQLNQAYPATVPIPAFLTGDFSRLLGSSVLGQDPAGRNVLSGQIFDPAQLRQVDGRWVSEPFPGNVINSNRISTVSRKITDIFSKNYQPMIPDRLTNNSTRTAVNNPWFHQTQFTGKGDHAFSDRNKLSGSFTWSQRPRILADQGGVWDPTDSDGAGGPFARARFQKVTGRQLRVSDNWTISSSLVNTLSLAYNRYRNPSTSKQLGKGWNKYLGLENSTSVDLFPQIQFGNAVNGVAIDQIGYNATGWYVGNTYTLSNSLLWSKGRHTMKFGGQLWRQEINSHAGLGTVAFTFTNNTTGVPGASWANRVGFGFASFLLGQVDNASKNVPFDLYGRRYYVETFFQDDIKVTRKFTLNLGLRWEQPQPLHEKYGHWASFDPTIRNTRYGNLPGALAFLSGPDDSFERNKDWKAFAPRIGAAYRITNKAVLRGGYGIFYTPIGIGYWNGVPYGFAPGFRGTNNVLSTGNRPRFNWDSGYPDNYVAPTQDANFLTWGMVSVNPDSLIQGYTHQYNVSFQYELGANLVAEATYMGNRGVRLQDGSFFRNQPRREAYEDPRVTPSAWVSDAASAAAAGVPYPYPGFAGNAGFVLQPFPHVAAVTYGPIYGVGASGGYSRYDSLQLQLTKRMGKGLAAQASYSYSKARGNLDTQYAAFGESWDINGGVQDIYNLKAEANAPLSFDQRHILKGYIQYALPVGKGRRFLGNSPGWANAILGGWDITCIYKYNTGIPLGVSPQVNYPGWEGQVYADWNQSVGLSRKFDTSRFNPAVTNDPTNLYFDRSAFSNPTNHRLGNGMRRYDQLRGFGWSNEDIGLLKYWHFGERANLQFRAEILNLFNRHHFADPATALGNVNTFGFITGMTGSPRNIQLGLRLGW